MKTWNDPTVITDILPQTVSPKSIIEVQCLIQLLKLCFSGNRIFFLLGQFWWQLDPEWIIRVPGSLVGGGGRKKNKNVKGVGGTPGSSHANPIQKEEKIFSGRVRGSVESGTADTGAAYLPSKKLATGSFACPGPVRVSWSLSRIAMKALIGGL